MTAGSSAAAADRASVLVIFSRQSLPEFPVTLLETLLHALFDLLPLFMEMFELSQMLHPGLFLRCGPQFLLDSLGDELAQRNTAFSRHRLGSAEQEIGDFEGCFFNSILPFFMGTSRP